MPKTTQDDVILAMISPDLKRELDKLLEFVLFFVRHPIEGMRRLPDWHWSTLLSLQIGISVICGAMSGLLPPRFTSFFIGIFLYPIISFGQVGLLAVFLVFYFSVRHSVFLEHRRLASIVVLANVPYTIMHIFASVLPPLQLIGFAGTCLLLIVGMSEHFHIERRKLTRLMTGLFVAFACLWAITQYRASNQPDSFERKSIPKPVDVLESELKQ